MALEGVFPTNFLSSGPTSGCRFNTFLSSVTLLMQRLNAGKKKNPSEGCEMESNVYYIVSEVSAF